MKCACSGKAFPYGELLCVACRQRRCGGASFAACMQVADRGEADSRRVRQAHDAPAIPVPMLRLRAPLVRLSARRARLRALLSRVRALYIWSHQRVL